MKYQQELPLLSYAKSSITASFLSWLHTLESKNKEIKPVNLRRNQPWILIGRTDTEAEALILWTPDANSQLTGKDPDARKDWRQKEKGWQRMRIGVNSRRWWGTGKSGMLHAAHGVAESGTTQVNNNDNNIFWAYMSDTVTNLRCFNFHLSWDIYIWFRKSLLLVLQSNFSAGPGSEKFQTY